MQTRHFTDVPLPIQQKCSFHFHKHDENNISSEICTLEVLLINLHFKECKGFIWKKKKKEIVPCGLLYSSDDTKAEFNNCFIIHSKLECIENL